jgi:hypothetical protein
MQSIMDSVSAGSPQFAAFPFTVADAVLVCTYSRFLPLRLPCAVCIEERFWKEVGRFTILSSVYKMYANLVLFNFNFFCRSGGGRGGGKGFETGP